MHVRTAGSLRDPLKPVINAALTKGVPAMTVFGSRVRAGRSSVAAVVFVLALSACSQTKTLAKVEVETQAAAALTAQVGQQAPPITCPGDLEAKVGASEVCAITLDSGVYDVTITVTALDEATNNATFDVKVATQPRS